MNRYTYSKDARTALEGMQQPLAVYQLIGGKVVTLLVSDGFCKLLGYADREQAVWDMDHDMYKDLHPDDLKRISDASHRFAAGGEDYDVVFRTRAGVDSDYRVIHAHGKHVYTEEGIRLAHVWYMDEGLYIEGDESVGTRMNRELNSILHEESILRTANYDALTGLPNLAHFFKLCEIGKARVFSEGKQGCLLYIDLNGMKYYNHRKGFAEGDKLLKAFAELLAQTFGHEDCCHIGSDRFAVSTIEDGLEDRLNGFFDAVERMENHLPVRVGIYSTSVEDVPVSSAYDRAKIACDTIRKSETSHFCYYTRQMSDASRHRSYIRANIDRAISERWIKVYYQAIVRAVNERVCDEEALARWIDPELGCLSPAEFIPVLEASGQIYKLDLCVLEQVLEKINRELADGLTVVPHSINLSRSDFDACDIVEEIRRRVDAAGVRRNLITIEITESVIGSNLDFMKSQVERFRQLGFPVWMDDFGSGYSSLNVLQSIRFDLIKFDMSFMRELDETESTRTVLTELMKLATSLGLDTVCEGVETSDQARFLQEIGCLKLQGFYYSKPVPVEQIADRSGAGQKILFENPGESAYYEAIGRVNLYDLAVVANEDEQALQKAFNTLPMCILEIADDHVRYIRSSQSYRDFMLRFFGFDVRERTFDLSDAPAGFTPIFIETVRRCCDEGGRAIFDGPMPDGSRGHTFARRIAVNPITGSKAVAIAVLSVSEPNEEAMIERMLTIIEQIGDHIPGGFYISKADGSGKLLYANKAVCDIFGCDDLEEFKAFTGFSFDGMIHPEDRAKVVDVVDRMEREGRFDHDSLEYRIVRKDGEIRWVKDYGQHMKSESNGGLYFVFITDITGKHLRAETDKALRSAVIEALTKLYGSVWLISDLETQQFELFRVDPEMTHRMPADAAAKFEKYYDAFVFYSRLVLEEDRQRFLEGVTPDNIAKNMADRMVYSVPFRRVYDDGVHYCRVEFTRLDLPGGKTGIVTGFKDVDEEVRRDQQIQHTLNMRAAVIEALTRAYDSVWIIRDLETQQFELFRVDEKMVHLMPAQAAAKISRFHDAFTFYSRLVVEEDRQRFLDAVSPGNIAEHTQGKAIYSVPFRRRFEDGVRNYRVEFTRLELASGEVNIVTGFKDVDGETQKDKA